MSNKIIIREANAEEIEQWDSLIENFENHRVSHTSAWLRSLEKTFNGKLLFLIFERNGEKVAYMPGMIVKIGLLKLFGSPLPGWQTVSMGPVFDEKQVSASELIEPLAAFLERKYGIHHIEITSGDLDAAIMEKSGFRGKPEYTFKMPLFPGEENRVLKGMKSSARRNITRGKELGLRVNFRDDEEFVDEIYDQIQEVFVRGGNTVPFSKTRVLEYFRNMKEKETLLAISVDLPDWDISIATGLFTIENKELVLFTWTHRAEHGKYRPTELMTWTAMQKAMEMGCTSFDLAGRGDFKAKFGAKMNGDKTRWVRSRYRWLTVARDLTEKVYRFQQSIRGKIAKRKLNSKGIQIENQIPAS